MEFKNIKNRLELEHNKNHKESIKKMDKDFKNILSFYGKTYKGTEAEQKKKFLKYLKDYYAKRLNNDLNILKSVERAGTFKEEFIITVEWKKSRMWGSNPRAYTNEGFVSESIGGCGYCKLSTATAQALNSNLKLLKLLYAKKEKALNKPKYKKMNNNTLHREVLGYGCGYGILPQFEGGVGISSHQTIIENIGLKMRNITSTSSTDVYLIKCIN